MSKKYDPKTIAGFNEHLKEKTPLEVVKWAISKAVKPIITTNFRPFEAAILHLVTQVKRDIKIIWCDTGYNIPNTYKHAEQLIKEMNLNIGIYLPKRTKAHRDALMGIPSIEDPLHKKFTEEVKIEPFQRAMQQHKPDVWFTNLRKGQTAFRNNIDIVSQSEEGILKISPFYHYNDEDLTRYLQENNLPNELKYFDPTKALNNRECGLHN